MANKQTTGERLAVIDEQLTQNARDHKELKNTLININDKLDKAIIDKADKEAVDSLSNKMWTIAVAVFTAFLGLVIWLIQNKYK